MSLSLYMDVHVDGRVSRALRERGIDVLRAQDDTAGEFSDPLLLDRATELRRVTVTYDDDFLIEGVRRLRSGVHFAGIIFVHPRGMTVGELVEQLQVVAECTTIRDVENQIIYVPL